MMSADPEIASAVVTAADGSGGQASVVLAGPSSSEHELLYRPDERIKETSHRSSTDDETTDDETTISPKPTYDTWPNATGQGPARPQVPTAPILDLPLVDLIKQLVSPHLLTERRTIQDPVRRVLHNHVSSFHQYMVLSQVTEQLVPIFAPDWCRYGGGGGGNRTAAGQEVVTLMMGQMPKSATVPQVEAVVRLGLWYAGLPDALVIERQLPSADPRKPPCETVMVKVVLPLTAGAPDAEEVRCRLDASIIVDQFRGFVVFLRHDPATSAAHAALLDIRRMRQASVAAVRDQTPRARRADGTPVTGEFREMGLFLLTAEHPGRRDARDGWEDSDEASSRRRPRSPPSGHRPTTSSIAPPNYTAAE